MTIQDIPPGITHLNPAELVHPLGAYSHLGIARGVDTVFVAGQVSVDKNGDYVGIGEVRAQTLQAYQNVSDALSTIGLSMADVVKVNAYVVGGQNIPEFMKARVEAYAGHYPDGVFPPITLIAVAGLAFPELLVEVECVAALPAQR